LRNQRTIKNPVQLKGAGLHSGEEATVSLHPAESDAGVVFVRGDLAGAPRIPFTHQSVVQKSRQTAIAAGAAEVQTVEHLSAACFALGIDNLEVRVDGPEVPGMDGSGLPFVEALKEAGRVELKAPRKRFTLDETIAVRSGDTSIVAYPREDPGLRLSYTFHLPEMNGFGSQCVTLDFTEETFVSGIAPARTFCLKSEAEELKSAGFGRGASTDNTLVLAADGPVDNEFRFNDELARHKMLDLVGDLALLGCDLDAHIVATRTGHAANRELVRQLGDRLVDLENRGVIQADTGLDVREILKIIPHRYPFLFVDRVIELVGYQRAVGLKNVSFNEPHFQGHWPGQPIMPGVLQVEALAQLSGVLLLRRLQSVGKVAVLLAIDRIKFRRAVVPGDQLRLECETLSLKKRSGKVIGRATVNDELTCEAVMKFMLMDA